MSEFAIQMSGVTKRFGQHHVLRGIDLSVPEHSIFAFLGNNGEGKSTAIRLILGLLQVDHGEISIFGRDIKHARRAILQETGCIVDAPSLYPNLTAREFLQIGCILKGLASAEIDRVLDLVKLQTDRRRCIAQFSLGMKQRIAIAHALLGQPRLLILDEPTNGLDPAGVQEIRQLLAGLPETAKCSVFISSHQLDEVEKIATHVALLQNGKIQFQSPIKDLLAKQTGCLLLHVDDAVRAAEALKNLPYVSTPVTERQLRVEGISQESAYHVNAHLVHANIRLDQSIFEQTSLERWFHKNTQERAA